MTDNIVKSRLKCSFISSQVVTCDWGKFPNSVVISESLIEASRGLQGSLDVRYKQNVKTHAMYGYVSKPRCITFIAMDIPLFGLKYILDIKKPKPFD